MFAAYFIYLLMVLALFWAYCGYIIALYILIIIGHSARKPLELEDFPPVTLIIPCYNEAGLVDEKVKNVFAIDYPVEKLQVIFVDGQSDDQTYEKLFEKLAGRSGASVLQSEQRGKINQLNFALPRASGEIIINTDMDCLVEPDCFKRLIEEFQVDSTTALVGAHVVPKTTLFFEEKYWSDQNRIRVLESRAHSASIVIAPCYAFKKELMGSFPEDCIADDIFISFHANLKGWRSKYSESAVAYETRSPDTMQGLFAHKFRKGNAYIIELLRFLYLLPLMHPAWKLIFLTKMLQVVIIPWVIPFFMISSLALFFDGPTGSAIVVWSFVFLVAALLVTHVLLGRGQSKISKRKSLPAVISVFIVANVILLLNGILFPFYRQTSNYSRIKKRGE